MKKLCLNNVAEFIFLGFIVSISLILSFTYFNANYTSYFWGIGICLLISIVSKFFILLFSKTIKGSQYDKIHLLYHWGCIPILLVSPDFVVTRYAKDIWRIDVEKKRAFIVFSNLVNLVISSLLIFLFVYHKKCECLKLFCFTRLLSRFIEVVISFILDVTSSSKSSATPKSIRVILAITSYFEIIFLLFSIYYSAFASDNFYDSFINFLKLLIKNDSEQEIEILIRIFVKVFSVVMITHVITNYIKNESKNEKKLRLIVFDNNKIKHVKINFLEWSNIKECVCKHSDSVSSSSQILIQKTCCPDYDSFCDSKINLKEKGISKVVYSIHNDWGLIIGIIYKPVIEQYK